MINISLYKEFWLDVKSRIQGISRVILVRTEEELRDKIKAIGNKELFLVVVVPSSDTTSRDHDNIRERETCIIYVLVKVARANQTEEGSVSDMILTQDNISAIKHLMLVDSDNHTSTYHSILEEIDFSSMHTDPEYQYLECDGYSISFTLTTKGF